MGVEEATPRRCCCETEAKADRAAAKEPPQTSIAEFGDQVASDLALVDVGEVADSRRSVKSANFLGLPVIRFARRPGGTSLPLPQSLPNALPLIGSVV